VTASGVRKCVRSSGCPLLFRGERVGGRHGQTLDLRQQVGDLLLPEPVQELVALQRACHNRVMGQQVRRV